MGRPRKVVEFTEPQIAVALNDVELRTKAFELAQLCGEIDTLRAEVAEHAGTERKKIRALDKRRRLLAECVRTGNEMRSAQGELFRNKDKDAKPSEPVAPSTTGAPWEWPAKPAAVPAAAPSPLAAQAAAINAGDAPASDFLGPDEDWAGGDRSREEKPRTVEDRMIHAIDERAAASSTSEETPVAKAKGSRKSSNGA